MCGPGSPKLVPSQPYGSGRHRSAQQTAPSGPMTLAPNPRGFSVCIGSGVSTDWKVAAGVPMYQSCSLNVPPNSTTALGCGLSSINPTYHAKPGCPWTREHLGPQLAAPHCSVGGRLGAILVHAAEHAGHQSINPCVNHLSVARGADRCPEGTRNTSELDKLKLDRTEWTRPHRTASKLTNPKRPTQTSLSERNVTESTLKCDELLGALLLTILIILFKGTPI